MPFPIASMATRLIDRCLSQPFFTAVAVPQTLPPFCPPYVDVTIINISMDGEKPVVLVHSRITMQLCLSTDRLSPKTRPHACACISINVRLCVSVYLFTSVCSSVSRSTQRSVGYQCNWITSMSSCPGVC